MNRRQNANRPRADHRRRHAGRQNDALHLPPRVHKHGRGEKSVHARIEQSVAVRKNFRRGEFRPPSSGASENKNEKRGHKHGIERGNPRHSLADTQKNDSEPDDCGKGREVRQQGIQPRKHSRTGYERAKTNNGADKNRAPSEQGIQRAEVSAVPFPKPEKEQTLQKKENRGKHDGQDEARRREKAHELCARNKPRADARSHNKKCPLKDSHANFYVFFRQNMKNFAKNSEIMSDIVFRGIDKFCRMLYN